MDGSLVHTTLQKKPQDVVEQPVASTEDHAGSPKDEEFINIAFNHCQQYLGGSWSTCSIDDVAVHRLHGGMTNYLYVCSLADHIVTQSHEPRKVLLRIYGSVVDQKHRFCEGVIFNLLSERGFGPATYGVFHDGRIEQYLPARNLQRSEMADPGISKLIARKTAQYHCMKLPLDKTPNFLWDRIEKYMNTCATMEFEHPTDQEVYNQITGDMNLEREYEWLKGMLVNLFSPVVFCHNDLHEGNMLFSVPGNVTDDAPNDVTDDVTNLTFIDFDYSGYNYRGYDIANHFCEFMYEYTLGGTQGDGFIVNEEDFPSQQQQETFAEEYLATLKEFQQKSLSEEYDHDRCASVIHSCTVEELLHEINRFVLASHFMWSLWSIVQQKESKIDFQYLKYGKVRMDDYRKKKKELGF